MRREKKHTHTHERERERSVYLGTSVVSRNENEWGSSPRWVPTADSILNFTWFDSAPYFDSHWDDMLTHSLIGLLQTRLFAFLGCSHTHIHTLTHIHAYTELNLSDSSFSTKANGHILKGGTESWTANCSLMHFDPLILHWPGSESLLANKLYFLTTREGSAGLTLSVNFHSYF